MWRVLIAVALVATIVQGCRDNEMTFFIEHVKVPPEAPNCEVSPSDPWKSIGGLDLAFRNAYDAFYLVSSHLLEREDYDNLKSETDGIFVEGMETYVRGLDGSSIGGTEYFQFENYIAPESSDIVHAVAISSTVVNQLAVYYGCSPLNNVDYPAAALDTGTVPASWGVNYGMVYAIVRFLGHTNAGIEVQTPDFTFPVNLCCGCLVDWQTCLDPCERYCEDPVEHGMCTPGLDNGGERLDCRALYGNKSATWFIPGNEVNDAGLPIPELTNCSLCGESGG